MTPTALAAAAAIVVSVLRGNGPLIDFGLPTGVADFFAQLRAGLAWGATAVFGGLVLSLILVWYYGLDQPSPLTEVAGISHGWKIVLVVWVWIGAPFGEELMFRGILWGALEKRSWTAQLAWRWLGNRWVILAVTTLVFAAWHREWWRFAVLVWGGFAIGMARLRTGSVFASATAHSLNNSLPALAILFLPM